MKSVVTYRKKVLNEIKQYIQSTQEITDIIIAGDYNQYIREKEIWKFHTDIGVCNIYSKVSNIPLGQLDKTCKQGSKLIDSIAATAEVLDYVKGCQILDYNDIIETNHREYMVDVALDEYF